MDIEPIDSLADVIALLTACHLSADDISEAAPPAFFGIRAGGRLIGCVGLEAYGEVGLLRSLAVDEPWRGKGLANRLVAFVETRAFSRGVRSLYLFTSTAVLFFRRQGYTVVPRASAPAAIRNTTQYSRTCPSEAFMHKVLTLIA